jgi:hypothetical protein
MRTKCCVAGTLGSLSRILPEKPRAPHALKHFLVVHETRKFAAVFTTAHNWTHSEPNDCISTPVTYVYKIYLNIIPSHLGQDLAISLFLSVFFPNTQMFPI